MADLLPTFLVIGAMKAGTTSLCRDLEQSPDVFFPTVKEPHTLCLDEVVTPAGRRKYAALFRGARPDQQRGEGSTGYTKRPVIEGVAERAREVLGPSLKLVYIVRHPIDRIVSHHKHLVRGGDGDGDVNTAVRTNPELIAFSRYAMQAAPWIQAFGREALCVVRFEDYVADRRATVEEVCRFLAVDPPPDEAPLDAVHNAGSEALMPPMHFRSLARRITRSQFYKRSIHPHTPQWVRDRFKSAFYSQPVLPSVPLSPETWHYLADALRDDSEQFARMVGWPEPAWTFEPRPVDYSKEPST